MSRRLNEQFCIPELLNLSGAGSVRKRFYFVILMFDFWILIFLIRWGQMMSNTKTVLVCGAGGLPCEMISNFISRGESGVILRLGSGLWLRTSLVKWLKKEG